MPDNELKQEDYEEPRCLLDMKSWLKDAPSATVPMGRVIEKLDEYLGRDDWSAAERHLDYWLEEAEADRDFKGALALEGERMGLFRKRGREAEAMRAVAHAEELLAQTGMEDSLTGATTAVNIATVCKTFGRSAEALPYFEKARRIYEGCLAAGDARLGGLYNNLALALCDLARYDEALFYYEKALETMALAEHGEPERAVTCLNMADLYAARDGYEAAEERINGLLEEAKALLDTPSVPRNGYYAYVCECCAPAFDHYGWFADAAALRQTARTIYDHQEK